MSLKKFISKQNFRETERDTLQVTAFFYQELGEDLHAVVEIDFYQEHKYLRTTRKICRHLEKFQLTPQLLHDELTKGFPDFSPFDSKDFGGYTYNEILDRIEISELQEIAFFWIAECSDDICCQFDLMNEEMKNLFRETIKILREEDESTGKEITVEG